MDTITDIQIGGENIDLIMYQGVVLWEREAPKPPEPDPSVPTTYGAMQTMTNADCSTTRGTAFDARNGQTYYVQKIGNLCWMETNLRYAGDGNYDGAWGYADDRYATTTALAATTQNTNDDTRPLATTSAGYLGGTTTTQYTYAGYFNPNGSTTLDTATPTSNTTFYGYLYTWCAAMGGQANACNATSATGFDASQSICPAGWRLPTGNVGGEYQILNNTINGGSTTGDAGLRNNFLGVYSGYHAGSLYNQGRYGDVWSFTARDATIAYTLTFGAVTNVVVPGTQLNNKYYGMAVRCVL